jgi:hypothetical protein
MSATTITGHQSDRSGRKSRGCRADSGAAGLIGGAARTRTGQSLERTARRKLLRTDLDLARTWNTVRAWDWTT